MTQPIKSKSELPKWFSLEKYRMAKALDAAGWYIQLYIRACCLSYLTQTKSENISEILNLIREVPIIDLTKNSSLNFHYYRGMFYEEPIIEESKHGVHSLAIHELYMTEINVEKSIRTQMREYFDIMSGEPLEGTREPPIINQEVISLLNEPVHHILSKPLDQALLGVNLLLSDRELIDQFKAYLPILRKECDAELFKEKWHKPNFSEWVRLGVLPYLDLIIWEKENSLKIPNGILEEAIFSSSEGSEDRVRKTTQPKANKLISKESLAFLRSQIKRKQGEQSNE